MAHNDQTEQDRHRGGEKHQAARMVCRELESEVGPDYAGGDEPGAEKKASATTEASIGLTMHTTPAAI